MKAYSLDLRERILGAVALRPLRGFVDAGTPKATIIRTFHISRNTINNYLGLRLNTGSLERKPIPGRPAHIPPSDYPALLAQLQASPDATLAEHCQTWHESHGVRISLSAMHRTIARLGWTRKKRDSARQRTRPRGAGAVASTGEDHSHCRPGFPR